MQVAVDVLRQLVKDGYLTARSHPTADLLIWNYTPKAQFERYWTPETLMCRGLITDTEGTVVARAFEKFFNYGEYQGTLPQEAFTVTEKLDGSLGILFFLNGKSSIATRGSFTSEQAVRANAILHERYDSFHFVPFYTYLFEIIYPENRIVVSYGRREDLVLLAVIETETGQELDIHAQAWPFPVTRLYDGLTEIEQVRKLEEANAEGFVVRFAGGLRLKMKLAEYVRLHRIMTHVNERVIWELLRTNQPIEPLLEQVPDEFYTWVKRVRADLLASFAQIEAHCRAIVSRVEGLPTRKEQAALIMKEQYGGIAFAMLDKKNYQDMIWKLLYPEGARPFTVDEDA